MQANLKFARPLAVALGLFALSGTAYAADVVSKSRRHPHTVAELPVASLGWSLCRSECWLRLQRRTKEKGFRRFDRYKGFIGSVFGGYQWQQENFVYGGEAELGYNGVKGDDNGIHSKAASKARCVPVSATP